MIARIQSGWLGKDDGLGEKKSFPAIWYSYMRALIVFYFCFPL